MPAGFPFIRTGVAQALRLGGGAGNVRLEPTHPLTQGLYAARYYNGTDSIILKDDNLYDGVAESDLSGTSYAASNDYGLAYANKDGQMAVTASSTEAIGTDSVAVAYIGQATTLVGSYPGLASWTGDAYNDKFVLGLNFTRMWLSHARYYGAGGGYSWATAPYISSGDIFAVYMRAIPTGGGSPGDGSGYDFACAANLTRGTFDINYGTGKADGWSGTRTYKHRVGLATAGGTASFNAWFEWRKAPCHDEETERWIQDPWSILADLGGVTHYGRTWFLPAAAVGGGTPFGYRPMTLLGVGA